MEGKNKKEKTNQSVKEVFGNNIFLINLIIKASPLYLILIGLDSIRNQVSIFLEHTVGMGYVLEAAEFKYPFKQVAIIVLVIALVISLGMLFSAFVVNYYSQKEVPKVREFIKMKLYEKAKDVDLECYENTEFYNSQTLAISEVDKQIDRTVKFVQDGLSGLTAFITTGAYFLIKDKVSVVFIAVSFILSYFVSQGYNKQNYLVRVESIPYSRKRDYIKRVFYLNDYAKEIRLNPQISDILFEEFEDANEELYHIEKKYALKKWILGFAKGYLSNDLICDGIYVIYLVYRATVIGDLSFSTVAILFSSYERLKESLKVFTDTYPYACETSLYVNKIRKFLEYEIQITSKENLDILSIPKEIEFKDVSFHYKNSSDMLIDKLNLNIKPGEKIALVGYNGAGKTTLIKLLLRLYDVNNGTILSDGIDIKKYNVDKYRKSIGVVFQDFHVFAGTIAQNVYQNVDMNGNINRVSGAISQSGLAQKVGNLKNGLYTELTTEFSKEGINLSKGESQKLAISRVFYEDAGLMILDEPSSALDPIAEYQLNQVMINETKDKTVIFISHRLSTTRIADRILMLENGHIVEQGTHEELLKIGGKYANMWHVQAGAYIN